MRHAIGARSGTLRAIGLITVLVSVAAAGGCQKDTAVTPATRSQLADSADQVFTGIDFLLTGGGVMQGKLVADTGYMFDNNTRVELHGVRTDFYSKTGERTATLTSREGTYRTNSGALEARKTVVVVSVDGRRRLETEQLRYDQRTNLITTDSAFTITDAGQVHRGVGFETDPDLKRYSCKASCSGNFNMTRRAPPP